MLPNLHNTNRQVESNDVPAQFSIVRQFAVCTNCGEMQHFVRKINTGNGMTLVQYPGM